MSNPLRYSIVLFLIGLGPLLGLRAHNIGDDKKGVVVEIDGLKSAVPADWRPEEAKSQFRLHHFRIPHVADDKTDAELIVFFFGPGGGGTAEANVKRWKGMFIPPEDKKIEDVSKLENFKVGNVKVTYLDVQGTYKSRDQRNPAAKEERSITDGVPSEFAALFLHAIAVLRRREVRLGIEA